jgi:hypothetical protein
MIDDVSIDNDTLLMIDFVNLWNEKLIIRPCSLVS